LETVDAKIVGRVLCPGMLKLFDQVLAGRRWRQRPVFAPSYVQPLLDNLTQLTIDLDLIVSTTTRPNNAWTLADITPIVPNIITSGCGRQQRGPIVAYVCFSARQTEHQRTICDACAVAVPSTKRVFGAL